MKKIYYKLCLLLFGMGLFCACEEEMTLKPDAGMLEGIVFDGYITNLAPPYFFRLTHPSCLQENKLSGKYIHYENIVGAEVIITDVTTGIKDTLVQPACRPHRDDVFMYISYYDYYRKRTITETRYSGNGEGLYITTRLYGIEGHTYTLDIKYKDKHYSAREMNYGMWDELKTENWRLAYEMLGLKFNVLRPLYFDEISLNSTQSDWRPFSITILCDTAEERSALRMHLIKNMIYPLSWALCSGYCWLLLQG